MHRWTEIISASGAGTGWIVWLSDVLNIAVLVITLILTGVSLYLVWPKFWEKFKNDGFLPKNRKSNGNDN